MRRFISFITIALFALYSSPTARAQGMKDPTHWTYEVKKVAANDYQLNFILELDNGWHIWAINVGGDGLQIVPTFNFAENKAAQLKGNIREQGKVITTEMEGVEGKVSYYSDKVVYSQNVKVLSGTTIKGTHRYQVCNDEMCLSPKELPFSFQIP